ncbi:heterokaryon incompatibility protein-domain-containing protein [Boeremia exigua]|uniref:heterokaryon incompatibility protein-domain-containing protein n=1 Tax=Boeremia exigua TaxID=749465 RepID=UPI001E8E4891|nr:heterokaryon incompatibility protein-domain-containing protein [Boeremia exigua]KAH6619919.1 heterokaryon incompatibility protein-domain-containing protein [Boeremia exigua]
MEGTRKLSTKGRINDRQPCQSIPIEQREILSVGRPLCTGCRKLLSTLDLATARVKSEAGVQNDGVYHYKDPVYKSEDACRVCAFFALVLGTSAVEYSSASVRIRVVDLPIVSFEISLRRRIGNGFGTTQLPREWSHSILIWSSEPLPGKPDFEGADTTMSRQDDAAPENIARLLEGRLPFQKANDNQMFEWLRNRLKVCRSHKECQRSLEAVPSSHRTPLPTRVLLIERNDPCDTFTIRLQTIVGQYGDYLALSHCWGQAGVPLRTTKENLTKHTRAIEFDALPPTFRDAITVTSELGYNYLWIDSLCIVQDDEVDWNREANRMGIVYANAQAVIGASHAKDASYGLFMTRTPTKSWFTVRMEARTSDSETCELTLAAPDSTHSRRCDPTNGPLAQRAWGFQEQALAKRVLWFTDGEVVWQCRRAVVSETGVRLRTIDWEKELTDWLWVITQYSSRRVTKFRDRHIALYGLVELIRELNPGYRYEHGTWIGPWDEPVAWQSQMFPAQPKSTEKDWIHQLLWYRCFRISTWSIKELEALEASSRKSWSWIYQPGPVKFLRSFDTEFSLPEQMFHLRRSNIELADRGMLKAHVVLWTALKYEARPRRGPQHRFFPTKEQKKKEHSPPFLLKPSETGEEFTALYSSHGPESRFPNIHGVHNAFRSYISTLLPGITTGDIGPGAYIIGSGMGISASRCCGWAILDDDNALLDASSYQHAEKEFFIVPLMSWVTRSALMNEAPLHQVLILERLHLGRNNEAHSLRLRVDDPRYKRSRWHKPTETADGKRSATWIPTFAGIPRPTGFQQHAGTFRRIGCGVMYADAGLGAADDDFREITII